MAQGRIHLPPRVVDLPKLKECLLQVIRRALKKYDMIVADNGSNWYISGAPDPRWNNDDLHTLGRVKGSDFEVVQTGPATGP